MALLAAKPGHTPPTCPPSHAPSATVKLKDSCVICANAKIKCSKDKPTCKRCSKKGWPCEYSISRRAGRAAGAKHSPTAQRHARGASYDAAKPSHTAPPTMSQPSTMQHDDYFQAASDAAAWLGASLEQDAFPASSLAFDHVHCGPPFPATDTHMDMLDRAPTFDPSYAPDGFLDFNHHPFSICDFDAPGTTNASSEIDDSMDTTSMTHSSRTSSALSLTQISLNTKCSDSHTCLRATLDLLLTLSASLPVTCTRQTRHLNQRDTSLPAMDLKATAAIRALSAVLDCACSANDDNLLALMALVILKQLAIYTTIIGSHNTKIYRGACPAEITVTAQTIVSELHHFRRLVHGWSSRVAQLGKSIPRTSSLVDLSGLSSATASPNPRKRARSTSIMSDHSLEQLQTDLWVALNTVSADAIDVLR